MSPQQPDLPVASAGDQSDARRRQLMATGQTLIPQFWGLVRTLKLFPPGNATPQRALDLLMNTIQDVQGGEEGAALIVFGDSAFINGVRLRLDAAAFGLVPAIADFFAERGLGGLCFLRGIRRELLMDFLHALVASGDVDNPRQHLLQVMEAKKFTEVTLINPQRVRSGQEEGGYLKLEAIEIYARTMNAIRLPDEIRSASGGGGGSAALAATARRQQVAVRRMVELGERDDETFIQLGALRGVGTPTLDHTVNTTVLSIALARRAGLNRRHLLRLGLAAMNHNIGEHITTAEPAEVSQHPVQGMLFLLDQYGVNFRVLQRAIVAAQHHRHFDGRGGTPDLPRGMPHLFARIICLCDAYDSLLTARPDHPSTPPDQALKRITRGSGTMYDPTLVCLFVAMVGRYPPGTLVELDGGELAIVVARGEGEEGQVRPQVLTIRDAMGRDVRPSLTNLADRVPGKRRFVASIVRSRNPAKLGINVASHLFSAEAASDSSFTL